MLQLFLLPPMLKLYNMMKGETVRGRRWRGTLKVAAKKNNWGGSGRLFSHNKTMGRIIYYNSLEKEREVPFSFCSFGFSLIMNIMIIFGYRAAYMFFFHFLIVRCRMQKKYKLFMFSWYYIHILFIIIIIWQKRLKLKIELKYNVWRGKLYWRISCHYNVYFCWK